MAAPLIEARAWAPYPSRAEAGGGKNPLWTPLDFAFRPGDRVLLDGPSGCGKSTFLLALAGLLSVQRAWSETGELRRTDRRRGYLFQNPADRFCTVKAEDELAFGLENRGLPPAEIDRLVAEAAHRFGLETLLDRQVNRLSGGEQQRLALAALWAEDPEILFIDEAMSQLDAAGRCILLAAYDHWSYAHPEGLAVAVDHRADLWEGRFTRVLRWRDGSWVERNKLGDLGLKTTAPIRDGGRPSAPPAPHPKPNRASGTVVASCERLVLARPGGGSRWNHEPIDLKLRAGNIHVITGPNGAGKSMLLKTIAGLAAAHSGEVRHGPITLRKPPRTKKEWKALGARVSMALQNPELQFGAGLVKDHDADPPENLGLREHLGKSPFELSLGQQRRLSLSMLGADRPLLLLDEPFYGQDRGNTRILIDYIRERAANGTAVVLVCHDEDLSHALADELFHWDGMRLSRKERKPFYPWWEADR